jgi:signal transduction histidine kinase
MEGSPSIADKLARLEMLENEFQRTLEAEKLEALAEFAAGAGHEINNPLTVISGRAQLLLAGESDPERRHALALISAQAMRVYEMIADMMLFARPPRPELQSVDLSKLVDDFIAGTHPGDGSISRIGTSEPVTVHADPVQLTVALRAICQNALEATGGRGRIEIGLDQDQSETRIRIQDDGPGITPDQRRHIFDPFYSARQAGRGLGLGLSKAWRIVTNHGGRIEVTSQPNHGATFIVVLPTGNPAQP